MREIKSITVQGLGHWQIGDKIGDGIISHFAKMSNDIDTVDMAIAYMDDGRKLAEWIHMPCMLVYGE